MKERDVFFDNIKGVMLFLVAFGHILNVYCGENSNIIEYTIMKYIYLFHMPMFAFVTGYFSKNVEKSRDKAVHNILIPFIFFQSIYVLTAAIMIKLKLATFNSDVFNYSVIVPSSAFYYLLATFVWKMIAKDIIKLRFPLVISFVLGLIISLTSNKEFHVGYGAVFSLLPFFVIGLLVSSDLIKRIRNIKKIYAVIILVLGVLPAYYFPYAIHSIRFTYEMQGFSTIIGLCWRVVYYAIAVLMGLAILVLSSNNKSVFSRIGEQSILVYAASTFLSPSLYVLINHFVGLDKYPIINFICMVVFCLGITLLASMSWVRRWYDLIMNKVYYFIIKE